MWLLLVLVLVLFPPPQALTTPARDGTPGGSAKITVHFQQIGFTGEVNVYDIWTQKSLGSFSHSYTADVPFHGTAFLRLSSA